MEKKEQHRWIAWEAEQNGRPVNTCSKCGRAVISEHESRHEAECWVPPAVTLTEDEQKLCGELPDALIALADAHEAKASMAAAMGGYENSVEFHSARAEELRTEAKRIESTW